MADSEREGATWHDADAVVEAADATEIDTTTAAAARREGETLDLEQQGDDSIAGTPLAAAWTPGASTESLAGGGVGSAAGSDDPGPLEGTEPAGGAPVAGHASSDTAAATGRTQPTTGGPPPHASELEAARGDAPGEGQQSDH